MMTKKVTLIDVKNAYDAIKGIINSKRYYLGVQIALTDLMDALQKNYERYQTETFPIIKELGTPIRLRPGSWVVKPENMEIYIERARPINDVEVSINFNPIDLDFLLANGVELFGAELSHIRKFTIIQSDDKSVKKKHIPIK